MLPNPVDEMIQIWVVALPLISLLFSLGRMALHRCSADDRDGSRSAPVSGIPTTPVAPSDASPNSKSYTDAQRARDRAEEDYIKQVAKRKSLV